MKYFVHAIIYVLVRVDYIKFICCRHYYDTFLGVGEGTVSRFGAGVYANVLPSKYGPPDCGLANG
jgi:hypothetical protein